MAVIKFGNSANPYSQMTISRLPIYLKLRYRTFDDVMVSYQGYVRVLQDSVAKDMTAKA